MNTTDDKLKAQARQALDAVSREQPADWQSKLDAARTRALCNRAAFSQPWRLLVAAAVVGALALSVLLKPAPPEVQVQPVAEAGLYQDLEFYLWLAQELDSESSSASRS